MTTELFERAPTPEAMASLSPAEVESMIKSVGLAPKKAVYLVELSKKLVSDFNSVVPATYAELESLPGVGHKTASVLMSQSFGHPALAVDTHVHRLANRWGLSAQKNVDLVQKDLMETFPRECWNKVRCCWPLPPVHTLIHLQIYTCIYTSICMPMHLSMHIYLTACVVAHSCICR